MTKPEFDEMAALVVRLRDVTAGVEEVNEELTKALAANVDALVKSNAQCADYLRQNEKLAADRATLHKELVEVRAALASVSKERDSLRRTLDEWERADTKPHARIDEVAQTVPVCMQCLKERIKTAHAYETGPAVAILPEPLLPEGIADHLVPPVLPVPAAKTALCTTCHGCRKTLLTTEYSVGCYTVGCRRTMAVPISESISSPFHPYYGPCPCVDVLRHG